MIPDKLYFQEKIKEQIEKLYAVKLEDFSAVDNKLSYLIILNSGLLFGFIEFIEPTSNPYGLFIYLVSAIMLFASLLVLIYALVPRVSERISPTKLLKEYAMDNTKTEYERFIKEASTELANEYQQFCRIIKHKNRYMLISNICLFSSILMVFVYLLIGKVNS